MRGSHRSAPLPAHRSWRHTILYDDSLNLMWRTYSHSAQAWHNRSSRQSETLLSAGPPSSCTRSLRLVLKPGGYFVFHADSPIRDDAELLTLQLWVRLTSSDLAKGRCAATAAAARPQRACDSGSLCLSIRRSSAASKPVVLPLCAFGSLSADGWRKEAGHTLCPAHTVHLPSGHSDSVHRACGTGSWSCPPDCSSRASAREVSTRWGCWQAPPPPRVAVGRRGSSGRSSCSSMRWCCSVWRRLRRRPARSPRLQARPAAQLRAARGPVVRT